MFNDQHEIVAKKLLSIFKVEVIDNSPDKPDTYVYFNGDLIGGCDNTSSPYEDIMSALEKKGVRISREIADAMYFLAKRVE